MGVIDPKEAEVLADELIKKHGMSDAMLIAWYVQRYINVIRLKEITEMKGDGTDNAE